MIYMIYSLLGLILGFIIGFGFVKFIINEAIKRDWIELTANGIEKLKSKIGAKE